MIRTHLAFTVLVVLLFLPHVSSQFLFILIALVATVIPDIDSGYSTIGKMHGAWVFRFFSRHRGMFHSLTFALIMSVIFTFIWPVAALPFFIGYGFHIFVDSFTKDGVMPFWPYTKVSSGILKTGSLTETTLFIFLIILDAILLVFFTSSL